MKLVKLKLMFGLLKYLMMMSQNFSGHSEDLVEKVGGRTIEFILTY